MAQSVRDAMTRAPVALPLAASIVDAARKMREESIGDVIVTDEWGLYGIVTDRDIVVRALAEGKTGATIGEICTRDVVTVSPEQDLGRVAELMRERALRRVVVVSDGKLEGIISLGDLSMEREPRSLLSEISAAPPNG